jgi:hypothetical protein
VRRFINFFVFGLHLVLVLLLQKRNGNKQGNLPSNFVFIGLGFG